MDPVMPALVAGFLVVFAAGLLMRRLGQPAAVGYLLVGVALGPHGFGLLEDAETISRLGAIGVIFLLFFVGMEVSLPKLIEGWRVCVLGTLIQIAASVVCVWAIGQALDWSAGRIILLGFVISLSSTAVVIKMLRDLGELDMLSGRDVLGVLLVQDVLIIPMMVVVGLFGEEPLSATAVVLQVVGALVLLGTLAWVIRGRPVRIPMGAVIRSDHELQVFAALVICFGCALFTGLVGLSAALGAFLGGILVGAAPDTKWVHEGVAPFRVVFVSLFFISIGMLIDLQFVADHIALLLLLVAATFLTNTLLNAAIFRLLRRSWKQSVYSGALLAQVGELSFVLAAVGRHNDMITEFGYQVTVVLIAVTLLLAPPWILLARRLAFGKNPGLSSG